MDVVVGEMHRMVNCTIIETKSSLVPLELSKPDARFPLTNRRR